MKSNVFLRLLCSLPVILVFLYFFPFIGICLIILRSFVYTSSDKKVVPITLISIGIIVMIPRIISFVFDKLNISNDRLPYLADILNSSLYTKNLVSYGKYLITAGIILLIVYYVFKNATSSLGNKLANDIESYVAKSVEKDAEVSRQNDMIIKEKQLKAKNTSYVKCPNCGSDNLVSDKFGVCKYCRSKIQNKNYK